MKSAVKSKTRRTESRSYHEAQVIGVKNNTLIEQGIILNAETARKAIILSELINSPVAKRRRRR